MDAWYPLGFIPIPKSLAAKIVSRGEIVGTSSPYLDEMMMTNVRQFQIPRFPNDKRFQTKLCAEVVNSVSKLWVTQKDGYGVWFGGLLCSAATAYDDYKMEPKRLVSHKTSIYLRAPLKPRTFRVFCALVPSLVVEHGS